MPTKREIEFARLILKKKKVSQEQIEECLKIQKNQKLAGDHPKSLTYLLVERGYLTRREVKELTEKAEEFNKAQEEKKNQEAATASSLDERLGGYQLLEKLGEGAMGVVYKAMQISTKRIVALKILSEQLAEDTHFIERFCREARNAAKLSHDNIVGAYDVGESEGRYYFAMEFIKGLSLAEIVYSKGKIGERMALTIVRQVGRALQHAHQFSIVHRDIKPENILISKEGVVKLCDLGLAKDLSTEHLSPASSTVGTPYYISPEQARGDPNVDIRSDIYSLGICLYFMLTGELPYTNTVVARKLVLETYDSLPSVKEKVPEISSGVFNLIKNMTAKKQEERYQTPAELLQDIDEVIQGKDPGLLVKRERKKIKKKEESSKPVKGVLSHQAKQDGDLDKKIKRTTGTSERLRPRKKERDWAKWLKVLLPIVVFLIILIVIIACHK